MAPSDNDVSQRLKDLSSRVRAARAEAGMEPAPRPARVAMSDRMGLGFRIAIELVVCTVVGAGMGYGIDAWLGSRPFGMVIGLGFGFAAGVMTIYRVVKGLDEAVGLGRASRERDAKTTPPTED
jgi:ATP synthase protein I